MQPEVSVIIVAYNTESYIAQAIKSALEQTEQNIEVIVVDNASTDATGMIAKSFIDERLKLIHLQKNIGLSGGRNLATRQAKGKWIAPLDSDDWYAPNRLKKLLEVAYTEDADMIADDVYYIRDGAKSPWSTLLCESKKPIKEIIQIDPIFFIKNDIPGHQGLHLGLTKPLVKREFLVQHGIEYDETIKVSSDFWFDFNCLAHGSRFIFVPKAYYFYRSRSESLVTGSKVEHLKEFCQLNPYYLQKEFIKNNSELVNALCEHQIIIERNISYFRVIDPLKQRKYLAAFGEIVRNPSFFMYFINQLPGILSRRLRYHLFKIKTIIG